MLFKWISFNILIRIGTFLEGINILLIKERSRIFYIALFRIASWPGPITKIN